MNNNIRVWHLQFVVNVFISVGVYLFFGFEVGVVSFLVLSVFLRFFSFVFEFKKYKNKVLYHNDDVDKFIGNLLLQELIFTIITTVIFSAFLVYGNSKEVLISSSLIVIYFIITFSIPVNIIAQDIADYMHSLGMKSQFMKVFQLISLLLVFLSVYEQFLILIMLIFVINTLFMLYSLRKYSRYLVCR
jgi:hypothetical protein